MRLPVCFGVWLMTGAVVLAQPLAPQSELQPPVPQSELQSSALQPELQSSVPQPELQPSMPQPATSQIATQTYGAWLLRCQQPLVQEGSARRLCEIAQIVQDQNRQVVAQFVLGQRGGVGDWLLMVQIPVNVTAAAVLNLQVEGIDPILLPLRRCVGGSCFAEATLDELAMGRLRQTPAASRGSVEYELGSGGMVKMPFSLEGFTVAFNALSTR